MTDYPTAKCPEQITEDKNQRTVLPAALCPERTLSVDRHITTKDAH